MCPTAPYGKPAERVACAGAVVRGDTGQLLLILRAQDPARGRWSLPGGRVEAGETAAEAAAREVREETGLVVRIGPVLLTVAIGNYDIEDFEATVVGGQLVAGDDASDVRWCTPEELSAMERNGELTDGLLNELRRAGVLHS
ncbi:MAG: 8-oxo-dGTP diphosphatase [Frankiales bacterium]|jgi:ADP-ribose pyrophosphatase YjhB (NUDIX family)|nr:8-oxo-dGTP diphosphatase [Frankiales bacterium]